MAVKVVINMLSELVRDEEGHLSSARCSFWLALLVSLTLIVLAALNVVEISAAAYALLGTIFTFTCAWAAGPRVAKYLGPQIGRVVDAIGKAKDDRRLPDIRRDDESGQ